MQKVVNRLIEIKDSIPDTIHFEVLVSALQELDEMIGMNDVKEKVVEMVCENVVDPLNTDIGNHCMVTGKPGVGKTTFIHILAKIMFGLGIVSKLEMSGTGGGSLCDLEKKIVHQVAGARFVEDQVEYIFEESLIEDPELVKRLNWIKQITNDLCKDGEPFVMKMNGVRRPSTEITPLIVHASRDEIVGQYLGISAINMRKVYEQARGGILVLDEAYALMNTTRDEDSFGKEVIDTLNKLMSERTDTVVILGGYEDEIKNRLFSAQKGLESRIQYVFNIEPPSTKALAQMLQKRLGERCRLELEDLIKLLENTNIEGYGRGIARLVKQASMVSSKRRFFSDGNEKFITYNDLVEGLKRIRSSEENGIPDMFL